MIQISYNLATGAARLSGNTTIVLGADVPVRLSFESAPGAVGDLQLALGTDGAPPALLAITVDFVEENALLWTAVLDAGDARLRAFMEGKGPTTVLLELVCVIDGVRRIAPHLGLTVQPPIISGVLPGSPMGTGDGTPMGTGDGTPMGTGE